MKTPWHNKNGVLKFPYKPTLDRCFIWPTPPPEKVGREKLLYIPKQFERRYQDKTGIILSVGPGYYSKKGKWNPVPSELKPGVKVVFDHSVPWGYRFAGLDGKKHFVFLCGVSDVWCIVGK